jgi:hypothetical protein
MVGIYLLVLLLGIPQGYQHANWPGIILVIACSFLVLFTITKTTYLTFKDDNVIYVYALGLPRALLNFVKRSLP